MLNFKVLYNHTLATLINIQVYVDYADYLTKMQFTLVKIPFQHICVKSKMADVISSLEGCLVLPLGARAGGKSTVMSNVTNYFCCIR